MIFEWCSRSLGEDIRREISSRATDFMLLPVVRECPNFFQQVLIHESYFTGLGPFPYLSEIQRTTRSNMIILYGSIKDAVSQESRDQGGHRSRVRPSSG